MNKMEAQKIFTLNSREIGNGIDILQENVIDKHLKVLPGLRKGEGIFALTEEEIEALHLEDHEKRVLKPYYTSKQLFRYGTAAVHEKWILYTDRKVTQNIKCYPNIKRHLLLSLPQLMALAGYTVQERKSFLREKRFYLLE